MPHSCWNGCRERIQRHVCGRGGLSTLVANDVRVRTKDGHLRVLVNGHPLQPVIDGQLFNQLHMQESSQAGDWHLEGEFETRRLVLDLEKKTPERFFLKG